MTSKADSYPSEVAWTEDLVGVFTVAASVVGGDDTVAGTYGHNAYDTITDDVQRIEVRRGANAAFGSLVQGSSVFTLKDATGTYNPRNAASTLYALLDVMRPARTSASKSSTDYPLFGGFTADIEHDPTAKTSRIVCVDLFEILARVKPVIAAVASKRPDEIIGLILDACSWTDPAMRDLEASRDTVTSWSADGSITALALIQALLTIDLGWFFISAAGKATYRNRDLWYASGTPKSLTGILRGSLTVGISKDGIVNSQTVTRTGGAAQTYTDATSERRRGLREGSPITSDLLATDGQAMSVAQFIVLWKKDPRPPSRQIELVNRDETELLQILGLEIGDLVTVTEPEGGTLLTGRLQSLSHDVAVGRIHRATCAVQEVREAIFTTGASGSAVGGNDIVGY